MISPQQAQEIAVIDYNLLNSGQDLTPLIEKAFGPKGFGILFVSNIPSYPQLRKQTLPLFSKLADLPPEILEKYKRPQIFHSLGWSHGVEKFKQGYDTAKGSYYVNCCQDEPRKILPENEKYYTENELKLNVGNIWVSQIPEIQKNVKALSKMMIQVGVLLAKQIDDYASMVIPKYPKNHLSRVISEGQGHIGRMLHYFPFQNKGETTDDWCGWHNDHGSLTALCSAMYADQNGEQVQVKALSGGLYAQNRFSQETKIKIPPNMLAFQLGESTQIHTGGYLEATPHCVVRSEEIAGKNISRNTFALFMQPDHLEVMKTPEGTEAQKVNEVIHKKVPEIQKRWENGMFFKDFHMKTIEHYS